MPQVTGHEVIAEDDDGRPVAVEINASHAARGLPREQWCARCRAGLATHCPDRLVLGIHGLLGGFSPWILAPARAIVPLPADLDPLVATLLEPFAAAWHAVETIAPQAGDTVAVLGLGRLGTLVVAALAAYRRRSGRTFGIVGLARDPARAVLAGALGADEVRALADAVAVDRPADVVVETSGAAGGLEIALRLARREVHLKSTTGLPSCGLRHATELVVDELRLIPERALGGPPSSEVAIVSSLAAIDAAIRPDPMVARAAVGPRGTLALAAPSDASHPLLDAVGRRGVHITTSRCGDLRAALPVLCEIAAGAAGIDRLVTRVLPAERLAYGYAAARVAGAGKIVMQHPPAP
jgi:threonine dehydrogenase-like Zn-dependent dehydrogenase